MIKSYRLCTCFSAGVKPGFEANWVLIGTRLYILCSATLCSATQRSFCGLPGKSSLGLHRLQNNHKMPLSVSSLGGGQAHFLFLWWEERGNEPGTRLGCQQTESTWVEASNLPAKYSRYILLHRLACNIASYCTSGYGIFTSHRRVKMQPTSAIIAICMLTSVIKCSLSIPQ